MPDARASSSRRGSIIRLCVPWIAPGPRWALGLLKPPSALTTIRSLSAACAWAALGATSAPAAMPMKVRRSGRNGSFIVFNLLGPDRPIIRAVESPPSLYGEQGGPKVRYVDRRVGGQDHEIGELPRFDRPHLVLLADRHRPDRGRRSDRLHRTEPGSGYQ